MKQNVSQTERIASVVIGVWAFAGILRSQKSATLRVASGIAGAGLVWRGLSGHCPVYTSLGHVPASLAKAPMRIEKTILINKPLQEVEDFLRVADSAWQSPVGHAVLVDFTDQHLSLKLRVADDQKRTFIMASLAPDFSASEAGQSLIKLKGFAMPFLLDAELRKLKAFLETGEVPTVEGQPSGQRSSLGKVIESVTEKIENKVKVEIPFLHAKIDTQTSLVKEAQA